MQGQKCQRPTDCVDLLHASDVEYNALVLALLTTLKSLNVSNLCVKYLLSIKTGHPVVDMSLKWLIPEPSYRSADGKAKGTPRRLQHVGLSRRVRNMQTSRLDSFFPCDGWSMSLLVDMVGMRELQQVFVERDKIVSGSWERFAEKGLAPWSLRSLEITVLRVLLVLGKSADKSPSDPPFWNCEKGLGRPLLTLCSSASYLLLPSSELSLRRSKDDSDSPASSTPLSS